MSPGTANEMARMSDQALPEEDFGIGTTPEGDIIDLSEVTMCSDPCNRDYKQCWGSRPWVPKTVWSMGDVGSG